MNQLTWLIYLAGASGSVKSLLAFLGAVFFVVMVVATAAYFIIKAIAVTETEPEAAEYVPTLKFGMVVAWIFFFLTSITSCLMPTTNTVYLMAASQAGETVVTNPTAQELFKNLTQLLESKVQGQLQELKQK